MGTTHPAEIGPRERQTARLRLIASMREGRGWRVAAQAAGLGVSRATAYRLARRGDGAAYDRRRGQAYKLGGVVRVWLEDYCRDAPGSTGGQIQAALRARFDLAVSISQINRVRAALGLSRRRGAGGKSGDQSAV